MRGARLAPGKPMGFEPELLIWVGVYRKEAVSVRLDWSSSSERGGKHGSHSLGVALSESDHWRGASGQNQFEAIQDCLLAVSGLLHLQSRSLSPRRTQRKKLRVSREKIEGLQSQLLQDIGLLYRPFDPHDPSLLLSPPPPKWD